MPHSVRRVTAAACVLWCLGAVLRAQDPGSAALGDPVVEVVAEQEGLLLDDPVVAKLTGGIVGRPLDMADVRATISRLMSIGRFEDVQPSAESAPGGVRLRYVLVPRHPVDRVEFRGALGLSEADLRRVTTDRFGGTPPASRIDEVVAALRATYRRRGYPEARVTGSLEVAHAPDRATMVMTIDPGPRTRVTDVQLQRLDPGGTALQAIPEIRTGGPYDGDTIDRQLDAWVERMRSRGYYEARASHVVEFDEEGLAASVTLTIEQGPLVRVEYAGEPPPPSERDRLVPIRAEGSADEDLLEDSARAIEEYLFSLGYTDAQAGFTRAELEGQLTITFHVSRGPRYVVQAVRPTGNTAAGMSDAELLDLVRMRRGDPFVQRTFDDAVTQIVAAYRVRGFSRVDVIPQVELLAPDRAGDHPVDLVIDVTEGPRTIVRSVSFEGVTAVPEQRLLEVMALGEDRPYSDAALRGDRNSIELEYWNRGFERVVVTPVPTVFAEGDTAADVRIRVDEGPQILVDHVIIVGNRRTDTSTIERELLLQPGEPLGYSDLVQSRSRLIALGLFRRVQIETLAHSSEPRRDLLVQVEEAPVYSLSFGPGVEGGFRLRTRADGTRVERLEIAPRGFFEIGRRNLWGKNRSVNLFTRVSLRSRDVGLGDPLDGPVVETNYGFNEYRVLATYREPRVFGTPADVLISGIFDQAVRTTFNFITREARAELGWRLSRRYSTLARYTVKSTELFDVDPEADRPLIDRIFPQVRISKFAGSLLRDTRDDLLDATTGTFISVDAELAARAIGSEVGFVKSYLQAFSYHRLPVVRRTVLAVGARIGAAHGFPRVVSGADEQGDPVQEVVQDLPASERFFAGGDTTVRGFSLDRLGSDETISPLTGFPTGGNAVLVLNAEMRVALFDRWQGVAFVDAGNVFARPRALSVLDVRPAAGAGVWYRSPFGPVRLDIGFNLRPRDIVPGQRERGYVLHLALGPAF